MWVYLCVCVCVYICLSFRRVWWIQRNQLWTLWMVRRVLKFVKINKKKKSFFFYLFAMHFAVPMMIDNNVNQNLLAKCYGRSLVMQAVSKVLWFKCSFLWNEIELKWISFFLDFDKKIVLRFHFISCDFY